MIKVLGIDPGLAATGIGIVTGHQFDVSTFSYGCIRTASQWPLADRLRQIHTKLTNTIVTERPDLMVLEDVFFLNRIPTSALSLAKVAGVILLAGSSNGVTVSEIPVREAKRNLTGNGNATKAQLEKAVRNRLAIKGPIQPSHAADALGLALIGLYRHADQQRLMASPESVFYSVS